MFEWAGKVLSSANGPSTKRHVVAAASAVLCLVCGTIGLACTVWIWRNGDLGAGAVSALTFVAGILAGLAGSAYRKPDSLAGLPGGRGASSALETASDVAATPAAKDRV